MFISEKHCIGRAMAVQEDPPYPIHFLTEHQPGLTHRIKGVMAAVVTGAMVYVEQQPRAVVSPAKKFAKCTETARAMQTSESRRAQKILFVYNNLYLNLCGDRFALH